MCTGRRTGGARRSSSFAHVDAFQAHPCRAPSPGNPIPGREAVNRRRHLLPGHGAGVLRLVLAALPPFRRPVTRFFYDRRPTTARILLLTKGRNINRLPFRRPGVAAVRGSPRARHTQHPSAFATQQFAGGSGPPHSGPNAVAQKAFSIRQASRVSLEYLLLPPRSAPGAVSPGITARICHNPRAFLLTDSYISCQRSSIGSRLERHPFSGLLHSAGELLRTP
jgi:hypothetical protein